MRACANRSLTKRDSVSVAKTSSYVNLKMLFPADINGAKVGFGMPECWQRLLPKNDIWVILGSQPGYTTSVTISIKSTDPVDLQ